MQTETQKLTIQFAVALYLSLGAILLTRAILVSILELIARH